MAIIFFVAGFFLVFVLTTFFPPLSFFHFAMRFLRVRACAFGRFNITTVEANILLCFFVCPPFLLLLSDACFFFVRACVHGQIITFTLECQSTFACVSFFSVFFVFFRRCLLCVLCLCLNYNPFRVAPTFFVTKLLGS